MTEVHFHFLHKEIFTSLESKTARFVSVAKRSKDLKSGLIIKIPSLSRQPASVKIVI